jgi:hypothetical protein
VIKPHNLLEHAWTLLNVDLDENGMAKSFREVDVRRAISAAYYGLFHALTEDAANHAVSSGNPGIRTLVRRAFDHGQMKKVCVAIRDGQPGSRAWPDLFGREPEQRERLRFVASSFVELQEARHLADYDLTREMPWAEGARLYNVAGVAWKWWHELRETSDAAVFMTALLLDTRLNRRG